MSAVADNLGRQVGIIQAAIKKPFSGYPEENASIIAGLAAYLESKGTTDVRNLRWYSNPAADLEFFFDVSTGTIYPAYYGGAEAYGSADVHVQNAFFRQIIYQQDGRFAQFFIKCAFSTDGFPVFYAVLLPHGHSFLQDIVGGAIFVASFAVSFYIAPLAMEIGATVIGTEMAAAYPAIAQGVGQVCVNTALSGGDIKSAVIGAVGGGIGGGVGGMVASATDSTIIGTVAASVTKTAIIGGNIGEAAAFSLAGAGLKSLSELPSVAAVTGETDVKLGDSWGYEDAPPDVPAYDFDYDFSLDVPTYVDTPDLSLSDWTLEPYTPPADYSHEGANYGTPIYSDPTAAASSPSGILASVNGSTLSTLALSGLKLVSSWFAAGQPAPRASNSTVRANPDGTLTNVNGSVARMPAGTPYLTTQNSLVTNNGDGTYTTVSANGQIVTRQYAPTPSNIFGGSSGLSLGSLGTVSPVVLIGGAALAVLLLSRRGAPS